MRSSPLGHSHLGSVFRRCLKGAQPPLMLGLQLRAAEEQRNQYTSQRFLHVVARGAVFGGSQHVRAVALSLEEFRYAFTNTLSEEESQAAYERYAVPGPGRVLFQVALANFNPHAATSVDFHNDDRAPLLFIAGGKDHVSPAALNESNARRYLESKAVTVYEEFPLRSHFTLGEKGWEQVADYALTWAIENTAVRQQPATT